MTTPSGFDNLKKFAQNVVSFGATREKVRKQAEVELVECGIGPRKSKDENSAIKFEDTTVAEPG